MPEEPAIAVPLGETLMETAAGRRGRTVPGRAEAARTRNLASFQVPDLSELNSWWHAERPGAWAKALG